MLPATPLLELRAVRLAIGARVLQSDVSFALHRGEMAALCGPSGCGKTTLLHAVAALDDAAGGEILLEGRSAAAWTYPAFRRRVLLVEQRPALSDGDLETNLRRPFGFAANRAALPGGFAPERARALLERLDLGDVPWTQAARTLSQGQQQRLCLVRALLLEPQVLLLDEPTAALDEAATLAVEALLREAAARGLAALIVTHQSAQVTRLGATTLHLSAPGPAGASA